MIQAFLESWGLFHNTYLAGWLSGILLSLVGVLVVARDQIFLSAAVSQASTLGIALGMWIGTVVTLETIPWFQSDAFLSTLAVLFAMAAAMVTGQNNNARQESAEAMTGWVFLVSASGAILLLSHSPHGLEEIHRLLSSSLIGARKSDVWIFATLGALTAVLLAAYHRRILLLAMDPMMAMAVGMRTRSWAVASSAWLGLAAGLSMRSAGMLYTFGCLVLPALVAKHFCREVRSMFFVAPIIVLATGIAGFILANYYDYPPAQMTVALLCLLLALLWLFGKRIRP